MICRQNDDKRKRHDGTEKDRTRGQPEIAAYPRGPEAHDTARDCQGSLHNCRAAVARTELAKSDIDATGKPGRMLDGIDIECGAGEKARTQCCPDRCPHHEMFRTLSKSWRTP